MRPAAETSESSSDRPAEPAAADRRADVDAKQGQAADVLRETGTEALVILEPENFAWLTGGATPQGILDPADWPGLYLTLEARWLLARNVDAQRLFDEELDGLGFQLKEWPWQWGRAQLLDYLGRNRRLACDRPLEVAVFVAEQFRQRRLTLTPFESACLMQLGHVVNHALEATCRSLSPGQTEREFAGQVAHRLLHRGVEPVAIEAAADGRARRTRQTGPTNTEVRQSCIVTVTGRRYGLHATASRTVAFGPPDESLQKEHDAACKVTASQIAGSVVDAKVSELLAGGRRICKITEFEHDWRLYPPGHVTGRAAVEKPFVPQTTDQLRAGWAVTWQARIGAACSCDTYLISAEGPKLVTVMSAAWPQKRIKIQGDTIARPDVLQR
jgi:Xaa-Pro aminopeptidase